MYTYIFCIRIYFVYAYILYTYVDDGRTKPDPRRSAAAGNKRHQQQSAARRRTTSAADNHSETADEHTCLIRATKGNKKISTIVSSIITYSL